MKTIDLTWNDFWDIYCQSNRSFCQPLQKWTVLSRCRFSTRFQDSLGSNWSKQPKFVIQKRIKYQVLPVKIDGPLQHLKLKVAGQIKRVKLYGVRRQTSGIFFDSNFHRHNFNRHWQFYNYRPLFNFNTGHFRKVSGWFQFIENVLFRGNQCLWSILTYLSMVDIRFWSE